MTINVETLFGVLVGFIGAIALVFLILLLNNLIKLVKNINKLVEENTKSVTEVCENLPSITKNVGEITDNVKDISEVATEFTAEAVVAKDNIVNNYDTVKEIINIIASVFLKK